MLDKAQSKKPIEIQAKQEVAKLASSNARRCKFSYEGCAVTCKLFIGPNGDILDANIESVTDWNDADQKKDPFGLLLHKESLFALLSDNRAKWKKA